MDDTRRKFLKKAGYASLGISCALPLLDAKLLAMSEETGTHEAAAKKQLAMVIDIKKCQNKQLVDAAANACHTVHNVPTITDAKGNINKEEEVKWIWTEKFANTFPEQVHARLERSILDEDVVVLCNHCSRPPCVRVCPTQATWKRDTDGIVMMDMHRCIGCRYCMAACPYGARSFNWNEPRKFLEKGRGIVGEYPTRTKGVVEKCTFCADRLSDGLEPACVEAANKVPGGKDALVFGDLSDPNSKVNLILNKKHTICRKVGLGTGPNIYYII